MISKAQRPLKIRELSNHYGVAAEDYPIFRRLVKSAVADGRLARLRGGRLVLPTEKQFVMGKLLMGRSGYGFVISQTNNEEIFIAQKDLCGALHGEDVKVIIKDSRQGKSREGKVVQVLNREKGRVVGKLMKDRYGLHIIPDDPRFGERIEIDDPKRLAKKQDLVVTIRLYPWEAPFLPVRGHVEEVLGEAGAPGIDIDSLVITYGLPRDFDQSIKPELDKIKRLIPKSEIDKRLDLRDVMLFTIDPADAKDHDDAISLETLPNGRFSLGVHIADVSYYVNHGTALDREALMRGNSIYLVDRVIPMLPEKLSGDICSLHEGKDRLTLSFMAEIDATAKIYNWKFHESVICSSASLNYDEVQEFLDGKKSKKFADAGATLKNMLKISIELRKQRLEKGSLDFDLPEAKVLLDSEGKVIDIMARARMPSHQIVEEFMLLANKYTASYLESLGAPLLFRVHAKPDTDKIKIFAEIINEIGYNFSFKGEITPKKLQRVFDEVQGKPEEPFIEEMLLRSLAKAVYQPENIGHFGLAFTSYTHFTSPIRRYPDLLTHRVLRLCINGGLKPDTANIIRSTLKNIGKHCSATEIAADEAERESVKIKQIEFLSERVGGIFDGIISGVVKAGLFVKLMGSLVEGMVPFRSIEDDYYEIEEGKHKAKGKRTGKIYRLGDSVKVIVAKVDSENRRADFVLVSPPVLPKKVRKKKR